ncbi:hypothetical protein [Marinifilum sp. D737]|nr:hypothetical protein [Marinifilum sp. D737]MCY1633535.1 hypothetical protein [Marinifilum sp. D737]
MYKLKTAPFWSLILNNKTKQVFFSGLMEIETIGSATATRL